jgi:hypothetical protein
MAYRNSSSRDLPQAALYHLRSAALLSESRKSSQVIRLLLAQPTSASFLGHINNGQVQKL